MCALRSLAEDWAEMAPPADQPPSWARPTAAFHVGRWAVVMVVVVYLVNLERAVGLQRVL